MYTTHVYVQLTPWAKILTARALYCSSLSLFLILYAVVKSENMLREEPKSDSALLQEQHPEPLQPDLDYCIGLIFKRDSKIRDAMSERTHELNDSTLYKACTRPVDGTFLKTERYRGKHRWVHFLPAFFLYFEVCYFPSGNNFLLQFLL